MELNSPRRRVRRSRAEQKQETRDALVAAALLVFSRDGYHGASLDKIADEAGFSKGAVYSNFGNKAQLFLAVTDFNLGALRGEGWDPFASAGTEEDAEGQGLSEADQEAAEVVEGFALASLEFITTAARDETLKEALAARIATLLDAYRCVAGARRSGDELLPDESVARLMLALDQGASVLALSGVASVDPPLLRAGLRRLLLEREAVGLSDGSESPLSDVDKVRIMFSQEAPDQG